MLPWACISWAEPPTQCLSHSWEGLRPSLPKLPILTAQCSSDKYYFLWPSLSTHYSSVKCNTVYGHYVCTLAFFVSARWHRFFEQMSWKKTLSWCFWLHLLGLSRAAVLNKTIYREAQAGLKPWTLLCGQAACKSTAVFLWKHSLLEAPVTSLHFSQPS